MDIKKIVKIGVATIICVLLILGYYFYLTHRNPGGAENEVQEKTQYEQIIERDLELDYPNTPREVVKLFSKILECYYNEGHSEDEIMKLASQQFLLLDKELQDNNPELQYYSGIKNDIRNYKNNKRQIKSFTLCSSDEVKYLTDEDSSVVKRDIAYVTCSYFIQDKDGFTNSNQCYVLRKDEDGNWKILVYYLVEKGNDD